ncbi:hypothetical protein MASR2M18_10570 [Ignavibacteria bacterium]
MYVNNGRLYAGGYNKVAPSSERDDIYISSDGINFSGFLLDENVAALVSAIVNTSTQKTLVGTETQRLYQGVSNKWTQVTSFPPAAILSLTAVGAAIYAGTSDHGIYKSTDDGNSWTSTSGIIEPVNAILSSGGVLIAATSSGGGVYRSTNGTNWSKSNSGLGNLNVFTLCELNNQVFAGTANGIYVSTNGGQFWSKINNELANKSIRTLINSGNVLFAGLQSDGGVFRSTNDGQTWIDITKDIGNKNIYSLASFETWIYAAAGDRLFRIHTDSIASKQQDADTAIRIFSGMDATLIVNIGEGSRKYDFTYSIAGKTQPVKSGDFNFTKLNDTSYRWRAPYTDAEVKKLDGSTNDKKVIVTCVVSDLNNSSNIFGTSRFAISVEPALVDPDSNKQDIEPLTPNYTWRKIPGVQNYVLQVKPEGGSYPTVGDITNGDTIMTLAPSLPNLTVCSRFFWRVRVNNENGLIIGERSFVTKCIPLSFSQNFKDTALCESREIRLRATGQDGKPQPGQNKYTYTWKTEAGDDIPAEIKIAGGGFFEDTVIIRPKASVNIKCDIKDAKDNVTANFSIKIGNSAVKIQTSTGKAYFCQGGNLDLSLNKSFTSIRWLLDGVQISTEPSITAVKPGVYVVRASEIGDCEATDTIIIAERIIPKPEIDGVRGVCVGLKDVHYTLKSLPPDIQTIQWQIVAGQSLVNASKFAKSGILTFVSKGEIKIRAVIIDTAGCTSTSDDYSIIIGDSLRPVIIGVRSFCIGSFTKIIAGAADSAQWFYNGNPIPQENKDTLIVTKPGEYSVRIFSGDCSGSSDKIRIVEEALPSDEVIINNATYELTATDGVAWQWYKYLPPDTIVIQGATAQTYMPDSSGFYLVKITNAAGCSIVGWKSVPERKTLVVFRLTDKDGGYIAHAPISKTLQDTQTISLRISSLDAAQATSLGVAFYRVELRWQAQTIGMVNPPQPVMIINTDSATMEYYIEASKITDNSIADQFAFLTLTGGKTATAITLSVTASDNNKQHLPKSKIETYPATFIVDDAPTLTQVLHFTILARPNPTQNEAIVEVISEIKLPSPVDVYLSDLSGRRVATLLRKGDGIYSADCSTIPAGTYIAVAVCEGVKQTTSLQIRK